MKTVISHIIGGLGNQMFQYAAGLAAARQNGAQLLVDISDFSWYRRPYTLGAFNISLRHATNIDHLILMVWDGRYSPIKRIDQSRPARKRVVRHDPQGYRHVPELLEMGGRNRVYLVGHWQNERYFLSVREVLLAALRLRPELAPPPSPVLDTIRTQESVAVHIRRGDNISKPDQNNPARSIPQLGMVGQQYLSDSMRFVHKSVPNASFIVFSDEPDWVRAYLSFPFPVTIVPSGMYSDVQEFELMRTCKHQIIANSTFSWWAAWLNDNPNKIVCAPKRWDERLPNYDISGLIPSQWHLIG